MDRGRDVVYAFDVTDETNCEGLLFDHNHFGHRELEMVQCERMRRSLHSDIEDITNAVRDARGGSGIPTLIGMAHKEVVTDETEEVLNWENLLGQVNYNGIRMGMLLFESCAFFVWAQLDLEGIRDLFAAAQTGGDDYQLTEEVLLHVSIGKGVCNTWLGRDLQVTLE